MIPKFGQNGNLPAGIHLSTWEEIKDVLAFNERRQQLLEGMTRVSEILKQAGCSRIYIGGSFVSRKTYPKDFDMCWDEEQVDFELLSNLDINLLDAGRKKRWKQKEIYGGEIFPASAYANDYDTFLESFQKDKNLNNRGIVAIDL
ncbi:hypothetical protein VB620_12105 [Nodularia harveyana UHCC-0300]|uniref:Uncharacterized protein n=1 Tax=Nodularia harveyana UHCC-0300 TaxID=2974287 RepID=A0ABU5UFX4_9CYAN|nr:hypothetical protein [Nodularia harveyana]MEA5582084.1 hypothetical protein [Nodularia harveyana UHCC-0300]